MNAELVLSSDMPIEFDTYARDVDQKGMKGSGLFFLPMPTG